MKWGAIVLTVAAGVQFAAAQTNAVKQATMAEMERMYLDGKISAREFQRFLQTHRPEPADETPSAQCPQT